MMDDGYPPVCEPAQKGTVHMPWVTTRPTMTIGDFLLRRLWQIGIAHLFGAAGDVDLEFLQQLDDGNEFVRVGSCSGLNAAYAADGYARLNGISALVLANREGAWSAINGVAGAYREKVPVVCVRGFVPSNSLNQDTLMDHSFADTDRDAVMRGYSVVTAAQARLTPRNAVSEIDRLILTAWQCKLPVYLELPSDIARLHVAVPTEPLVLMMPSSDPEQLRKCADAVVAQLTSANSPAILIDLDAERFGVSRELQELAGKLRLPMAATHAAKGAIDETCPYYIGLYLGADSAPDVRGAVEASDCLLTIGDRRLEVTPGAFTGAGPTLRIDARADAVDIGPDNYQAVYLKELLRRVVDSVPSRESAYPGSPTAAQAPEVAEVPCGPLTWDAYWNVIQGFIREGDVLIADGGTAEGGGWQLRLPRCCTFVTQAVRGSTGYPVGSLLGTLLATPQRRHLLFVEDGSFQPTAQEISTMLRHDLKPIIFLTNNGGRSVCGKNSRFDDIADWAYADLPKVLYPGTAARTFVVRTVTELHAALTAPHDSMIFIEAIMSKYDAPPVTIRDGYGTVEIDMGRAEADASRSPVATSSNEGKRKRYDYAEGTSWTAACSIRAGLHRRCRGSVSPERPVHRRAAGAPPDRSRSEQGGRSSAALLGNAVRRVGAQPGGGRGHRLHPGLRAAWTGQRAEEDLCLGNHAGPLCRKVRGQGPQIPRSSLRRRQRRQTADADVLRELLRPLLGPPPRGHGRGHPGRGPADRCQFHCCSRLLVPDVGHRA